MLSQVKSRAEVGCALNGVQGMSVRACVPRGVCCARAGQAHLACKEQPLQAVRPYHLKWSDPSTCGGCSCSCPGHSVDRLSGLDAAHRCRPRPPGRSSAHQCAWRSRGDAGEIRLHYLAPSSDALSHGADGSVSYGGMEFANGPDDLTQPCPHHERAARCLG